MKESKEIKSKFEIKQEKKRREEKNFIFKDKSMKIKNNNKIIK